jgi:RNA polymerase sigma-70 factor (ECF subfamily)
MSDRAVDEREAELLRRLRRRDEQAFRELVERHGGLVRAYAAGILGDPHEAEDAAQEVFLRAFRRLAAFRGDASLATWLLRICRNHCLDRLRARPPETLELSEDLPSAEPDATLALSAVRVERERFVNALARLPEPLQQAIVLRELRGMAYDEVAATLGIPIGTVRSRLNAARAELRRALEP